MTVVAGLLMQNQAMTQDAATVGADLATKLNQSKMANTVGRALTGETDAIIELATFYGPKAVFVVLAMVISFMIASFVGRVIGGLVSKQVDLTLGRFLTKAIRNAIMFVVLLGVMSTFGVDVTSFAAVIAALGFAIGMALQGTLANFAAGIMLVVFRPFKVDDYIVVASTEGIVSEIDLFTTRLNTLDNRHVIIPNGEIFGNKMVNYSYNQFRRVDVNVGAEYSADLDATRAALSKAVHSIPGAVTNPEPQVYLQELGSSSVNWQVRVWCRPKEYWPVRERLTAAAKQALDAAGIGIPFPQMDVHLIGQVLAKSVQQKPVQPASAPEQRPRIARHTYPRSEAA
jgi:small conductance mechanosensitive channel